MQLIDNLKSERDLGDVGVIAKGKTTLREAQFTDADLQGIWALCRRSYNKYRTSTFNQFRELYRQLWLNNPARTSEHVFGWVVEGPHQEIGGF